MAFSFSTYNFKNYRPLAHLIFIIFFIILNVVILQKKQSSMVLTIKQRFGYYKRFEQDVEVCVFQISDVIIRLMSFFMIAFK